MSGDFHSNPSWANSLLHKFWHVLYFFWALNIKWGGSSQFSSAQLLSHVQLFATRGLQHARSPCPSLPPRVCSNSYPLSQWSHPTISSSVVPPNHLILCCPLLFLPSVFPSIRVFSNESALCIRWTNYWNFSLNISPSSEHPGLIFFRMDWLDFLVVQGTLRSRLQRHSSKASILQCSAFFIVQLSHPYMTTGKTIALIRRTFVGKVMSLLCNMLSLSLAKTVSHVSMSM